MNLDDLFEVYLNTFYEIKNECAQIMNNAENEHYNLANFAMGMMHYFGERCQAISALYQYSKPWDCEIIFRSALESTTKLLYVFTPAYDLSLERIIEFHNDTYSSEYYSRSKKSSHTHQFTNNPDEQDILAGITLSDNEENEYLSEWNRKKRKALSQKWSFSEMIKEIEKSNPDNFLKKLSILSYSYDTSSHFIHADRTAITMIWDRNNNREENEAILLENAHFARLFSDLILLLFLSYHVISKKFGLTEKSCAMHQLVLDFQKQSRLFFEVFYESQRDLYEMLKQNEIHEEEL